MRRLVVVALALLLVCGVAGAQNELAIVRSMLTSNASANYPLYPAQIDYLVKFLGEYYKFDVIDDMDVIDGKLSGYKLVILSDQGVMSDDEVDAFWDYVDRGGKIFATFSSSIRPPSLSPLGFKLGEIFGVSWVRWAQDPNFKTIALIEDHPMLRGLDEVINIGTSSFHVISVGMADVLGVRADADGMYKNEMDDAIFVESDFGVYFAFPLLTEEFLNREGAFKLVRAVIDYYAPGARK